MSEMTRKQREVAQREQKILDAARPMVLREGYHGLSMDRIAEKIEYSKGTIYNHFPCKEEIILALAIDTVIRRIDLFERASAVRGSSRERMQVVGIAAELFARLYPHHFMIENMIRTPSIWDKTSRQRQIQLETSENRCISIVAGIARDAVAAGDLVLPDGMNAEEFVFGLWSICYGGYSLIATHGNLERLGIQRSFEAITEHTIRLVDGYRWQPLSCDHDYQPTVEHALNEVFAAEVGQLSATTR